MKTKLLPPTRLALIRRLNKAAKTNENLKLECEERGAKTAAAYASGSQFAFSHAARLAAGKVALLLSILFLTTTSLRATEIIVGAGDPAPANYLDPGIATLSIATPCAPGISIISAHIVRTYEQQQEALAFFDGFPSGTLNPESGLIAILAMGDYKLANWFNAMSLTVGDERLSLLPRPQVVGVIGIYDANTIAFGGGNFFGTFGLEGSPISFFVQQPGEGARDYLNANQFITHPGPYLLGFRSNALVPTVPESGSTFLLAGLGFVTCALLRVGLRIKGA